MITMQDVMLARGFTLNIPADVYVHECGVALTAHLAVRLFVDGGGDGLSYYLQGVMDGYKRGREDARDTPEG